MRSLITGLTVVAGVLSSTVVCAATFTFTDPASDDFGPGTYTYPTHADYQRGSFDLRNVEVKSRGSKVEFRVTLAGTITDPWDSKSWGGSGFSLQMVQIYLDTDHKPGSGFTETLPGINASFAPADAWDRLVVISPQPNKSVAREVAAKAPKLKGALVLPSKLTVRGKTLIAVVKKRDLGGAPTAKWGFQAVMQSNEGFPSAQDVFSRRVNELPGAHRFGGGTDGECDPHVLDILVAPAKGTDEEITAQKAALAYECGADGQVVRGAVLPMVR